MRPHCVTAIHEARGTASVGGHNHLAIVVDDIRAVLDGLAPLGVAPEKPPHHPGDREELPLIAFVADPDGYRTS